MAPYCGHNAHTATSATDAFSAITDGMYDGRSSVFGRVRSDVLQIAIHECMVRERTLSRLQTFFSSSTKCNLWENRKGSIGISHLELLKENVFQFYSMD